MYIGCVVFSMRGVWIQGELEIRRKVGEDLCGPHLHTLQLQLKTA